MRERMSAVDAAWLRMDRPTNLMVITAVLRLARPPDWEAVARAIALRVVRPFPRFRQVVEDHGGRPHWVTDPTFELAAHLHRIALPAPGGEAGLQALVGDLMGQDLDRRRPLWQAWLVDDVGQGAAVVLRIHHCIADGLSLARVLLGLADPTPGVPPPVVADDHHDGHPLLEVLTHPSRLAPSRLVDAVRTGVGVAEAVVHDLRLPPDDASPFKGVQSARKVVAWADPIPLAQVKAIARANGATVNDVLLAALSGAIGAHLTADGYRTREIRVMVPVSLQDPTAPLDPGLGNHFALVFCPLPVGEHDPVVRLDLVKAAMDHIKATPEAIASLGLLLSMGSSPKAVEDLLIDYFSARSSMVVTNVRGPGEQLSIAGTPLTGILSWAPQSGSVTASTTIVSYDGHVVVGIATDPAIVPDPAGIARRLHEHVGGLAARG